MSALSPYFPLFPKDKDSAQVAVKWDVGGTDTNAKSYTTDLLAAGAVWEWLDDEHQETPDQAIKHEFSIPTGATSVVIVFIFTDVVYDLNDAPGVLGALTGKKQANGRWMFEGLSAPVNPPYPPTYREPNATECPGLKNAVEAFLTRETGFTLKVRHDTVNTHNTGFDLVKP